MSDCCSGCSAPKNVDQEVNLGAGEVRTTLVVVGMDCGEEVRILEKALLPVKGVRAVQANVMTAKLTIVHDRAVMVQQLIDAIAPTGMSAHLPSRREGALEASSSAQHVRLVAVVISGLLTGCGLVLESAHAGPPWLPVVVFVFAVVSGGWFIFPKAVAAARRVSPDMNLLMTVAVIGAAILGEWSEAAAVTFLFGLSELLEAFSVQRARHAIESLMELTPETALILRDGIITETPVEEVPVGAVIAVKNGARVPLDGRVVTGKSSMNQAPITGESMPVEKQPGDEVFAGSINGQGALEVRVTKPFSDTMLARIIHLVEEAQGQKAPSQRFVDVFAKYYTPAVMALAAVVFLVPPLLLAGAWATWAYRALVLLVIACPCALVISTPVSIVSGLTAMARHGVLIKGGAFLEEVGKLRALALDKTGTVTEGRPRVQALQRFNGTSDENILRIAAAIDSHSDHPLAQAVVAHARDRGITFPRGAEYRAEPGRGAQARIDEQIYFVGNHRYAHEHGVCTPELEAALEKIEAGGQSVVVVGRTLGNSAPGVVLGVLSVGDTIRPQAVSAIRALHNAGVAKVVMLSGDNQRTAEAVAKQAGIDEVRGNLLPDQKIEHVKRLLAEYRHVGMVGDGVNDAPAMAMASVGIAMGAAGTDTAIETADIALMKDDLTKVAEAVRMGRRTVRIIQFNIAFALALKAVFLILAVLGYTSLWLAIAADTGATLVVIANSLRLLRIRGAV